MRRLTSLALLSVTIVAIALYHPEKVHATPNNDHHGGCSVASLKGTYAFRRTGVDVLPDFQSKSGPIAQIGIAFYGGDGTRGFIRTTRSTDGVIRPWTDEPAPNGSYTVEADCTGTEFYPDGTPQNNLVVLDGGKRFFLLAASTGTAVTAEMIRLEEEKE